MAFQAGNSSGVLVAQYDVSAYLKQFQVGRQIALLDTTTMGDTAKDFIPGLHEGKASLGGLFDGATTGYDAILSAAFGAATPRVITVLPSGGGTQGNRALVTKADEASYDVSSSVDGLVEANVEFTPSAGVWGGHVAHILQAETTATNTSSVDGAAATTSSWVANLHVTAFSGTSIAIKIQDSADNSSWADLSGAAFASVTAATSEQLVGAAGATVRRYTRVLWTGTFTSCTFLVALSRKA